MGTRRARPWPVPAPVTRGSATLGDVPRPLPVALCVEPVHDPDADAAWVALTVEAAAPLGEVLDLDAAVLAEWSTRVGRHVLDRLVVMMYPADDGRS